MPDVPVCAIIADQAVQEEYSALIGLLEAKLSGDGKLRLVERNEIDKVLKEQELGAAFAAEGVARRIKLGALLKADLLVFLRERENKEAPSSQPSNGHPAKAVDLAVAETTRGLRLVTSVVLWDAGRAEAIVDGLAKGVMKAREIARQARLQVFAVPAFESKDIMPEYSGQRRGFAMLVEDLLSQVPGVAIVELAEAQALARESAISGQTVSRDLPYYLLGTYKTLRDKDKETTRFDFEMDLRHGEQSVARSARSGIDSDRLAQSVRDAISQLLPQAMGTQPVALSGAEVDMLLERAELFWRLVEWDQALPLYESVLLLDPKNEAAHLRLFEGYMVYARQWGAKRRQGWPLQGPVGRLRFGEKAISHASALLRQGCTNLFFLDELSRLTITYQLSEWRDDPRYPALNQELQRIVIRLGDDVRAYLEDLHKMDKTGQGVHQQALRASACVLEWVNRQWPIDQLPRRDYDLVVLLDQHGAPVSLVFAIVAHPRLGLDDEFVVKLEQHLSPRVRQVGHLCRLLSQVTSEQTLNQRLKDVESYVESEGLRKSLVSTFAREGREMIAERIRSAAKTPASAPAKDRQMFLPRLTMISDRWDLVNTDGARFSEPPWVFDWLVCRPGLEIVCLAQGMYRVDKGNTLTLVARVAPSAAYHPMQHEVGWDGKYIWVPTPYPKSAIAVIDPDQGEVARFEEEEVTQGSDMAEGRLACVRRGQALFFGCWTKGPSPLRTWAVVLEIERTHDGTVRRRFNRLHEARETMREVRAQRGLNQSASTLRWVLNVPTDIEPNGPWVMVRTSTESLIVDIPGRQVRRAKRHWLPDCPIHLDNRLLVPCGSVGGYQVESALRWSDHPDHPSELVLDWGERHEIYGNGHATYFRSAVMYEGWLHLIGAEDAKSSPTWIAVNPKTWETRVLVDLFPRSFPLRYRERLCASNRHGLIFISGSKAYRVELPPVEQWPIVPAKSVLGWGEAVPASRPR